jgi:hypothetical protein
MRKLIGLMALLAALGVLGVAAAVAFAASNGAAVSSESTTPISEPTAPAEGVSPFMEGCDANRICTYGLTGFREEVISFECSSSGRFSTGGNLLSALNRCGNKTDWLQENATTIACMNPGGERPSPGAFDHVFIAAEYGAFC